MTETIITIFREWTGNDYLTLFLLSVIPIVEQRGAIILMGGMEDINMVAGMFCCVAGSSVMVAPLILVIRPIIRKMKESRMLGKLGKVIEEHLSDRASEIESETKIVKRKMTETAKRFWGVLIFVAVPLPMTGSWTGSAIASIINLTWWKGFVAVVIGNIIAGGILTATVTLIPAIYIDYVLYAFIILAVAVFLTLYFTRIYKRQNGRRRQERHLLKPKENMMDK